MLHIETPNDLYCYLKTKVGKLNSRFLIRVDCDTDTAIMYRQPLPAETTFNICFILDGRGWRAYQEDFNKIQVTVSREQVEQYWRPFIRRGNDYCFYPDDCNVEGWLNYMEQVYPSAVRYVKLRALLA